MDNTIHTLNELIDLYIKGDIKEEGKTYACYISYDITQIIHVHDSELKSYKILYEKDKEKINNILWNTED